MNSVGVLGQMNSANTSSNDADSRAAPTERGRFVAILPIITTRMVPLVITFSLGVTLATAGWYVWSSSTQLRTATGPQPTPAPIEPSPSVFPMRVTSDEEYAKDVLSRPISEALAHTDEVLLSADFETALMLYEKLLEHGDGQRRQELEYRIATCSELTGNTDRALKTYQGLIAESDPSHLHPAAKIGIARTKARAGEFRSARIQLCETVLDLSSQSSGDLFRGEVCHLLAFCHFQSDADKAADLLDDDALAVVSPPWSARHILRLAKNPSRKPDQNENANAPGIKVVHRFGSKPNQIHVRVVARETRLADVLSDLSQQSQLRLNLTSAAEALAAERTVNLSVKSMSLAFALDCLLTPLDLTWDDQADILHIGVAQAGKQNIKTPSSRKRVLRALQYAAVTYPDHPYSQSTYMGLAHMNHVEGRTDNAAAYYKQFLEQFARSPARREAWFNLAKMRYQQSNEADSIDAFLRVVDLGREHPLAATSYLFVGRIHLETGEPKQAVRPLKMALSLSARRQEKAKAVVSLASAYSVQRKFEDALRVVHDNRTVTISPDDQQAALLVSRYARFATASRAKVNHAGAMLVSSLTQVEPNQFFGFYGYTLLGQIYRDVGVEEQMARLYRAGIKEKTTAAIRNQMMIEVAQYDYRRGAVNEAEKLLNEIVQNGKQPFATAAHLQLAQIAFDRRDDELCMRICTKLIHQPDTEAKMKALRIMGGVYQRSQNYENASLCFAGILPEEQDAQRRTIKD